MDMETIGVVVVLVLLGMSFYVGVLWGKVLESSERAEEAKDEYIRALEESVEKSKGMDVKEILSKTSSQKSV